MLKVIPCLIVYLYFFSGSICSQISLLEKEFRTPPEYTRPAVYWYWMNDDISKKGITNDLEAMAKVGIGEAFIGNIEDLGGGNIPGTVHALSDQWWEMVHHAIREGNRTGVKVGMFNCPGWSQSGGPWISEKQTMRYLDYSEMKVQGPADISVQLAQPKQLFQDVAVIAFPEKEYGNESFQAYSPTITGNIDQLNYQVLIDKNTETAITFPANAYPVIEMEIELNGAFRAQSLKIYPAKVPFTAEIELQAEIEKGTYQKISSFQFDRKAFTFQGGSKIHSPVSVNIAATTSKKFKLIIRKISGKQSAGFAEIEILGQPLLHRYYEKQLAVLAGMAGSDNRGERYPAGPTIERGHEIKVTDIINISQHLSPDGKLSWKVPEGKWTIMRLGMVPTGAQNGPTSIAGRGFEIDKMNKSVVEPHFEAYLGKILKRLSPEERKSFGRVVADSYETGPQNWTDNMTQVFTKTYGYDPLPWLAVLSGRIIENHSMSDRFLWDLRRLVAEMIATEYVGGLREVCEKNNLRLWLENYGHWGFPSEFLLYGGQSHDIGGEFWVRETSGRMELKAAASAAHIYEKKVVSAEAFTNSSSLFVNSPYRLKKRCNWAHSMGVNHYVLHVYIHQPREEKPGITAWFGTEFNRHNSWFMQLEGYINYFRKTQYLMQQGSYVADAAYFIGEDTPAQSGPVEPGMPAGYNFDFINADVILNRLTVKNGIFHLPNGMQYKVLVLPPPQNAMRPEVLIKIMSLIKAGGTVVGQPPVAAPGLKNYPQSDKVMSGIVNEVWGNTEVNTSRKIKYGKGTIFTKTEMTKVFESLNLEPDISNLDFANCVWLHRSTKDAEIYYLANQKDTAITIEPSFRVSGRFPELWNAEEGKRYAIKKYTTHNNRTSVALTLAPFQSVIVVFNKVSEASLPYYHQQNKTIELLNISNNWKVTFDKSMGGPAKSDYFNTLISWHEHSNDSIKYFSGTAVYENEFDLKDSSFDKPVYLQVGKVNEMATVYLNNEKMGIIWSAPWELDITKGLQKGKNTLRIEVSNLMVNRLIGDAAKKPEERLSKTTITHYLKLQPEKRDSHLQKSGIEQPVRLIKYVQ